MSFFFGFFLLYANFFSQLCDNLFLYEGSIIFHPLFNHCGVRSATVCMACFACLEVFPTALRKFVSSFVFLYYTVSL